MILVALRKNLGKIFEFPPVQSDKSKLTLRHILDIPADVPNQTFWHILLKHKIWLIRFLKGGRGRVFHMRTFPQDLKELDDMKRYHAPNFYRRFSREENKRNNHGICTTRRTVE
mgnify:CR=1 FL=1